MKEYMNNIEKNTNLFFSECVGQMVKISNNNPVDFISNFLIEPTIIDYKIIETINSKSEEGRFFSGAKMLVYVKLVQKLIYATNNNVNSVHSYSFETFKTISVQLPLYINDKCTKEVIKLNKNKIKIVATVEEENARRINHYEIFTSSVLCLDIYCN